MIYKEYYRKGVSLMIEHKIVYLFPSNIIILSFKPVGHEICSFLSLASRSDCDPSSSQSAKQLFQCPKVFLPTVIVDDYISSM